MSVLEWDKVGERSYQFGVDRGVLYLEDKAVVWNGLTGVEEDFNRESKPFYQDGIKYLDYQVLGEYSGKLTAFTYPDEFEEIDGVATKGYGLYIHDQRPKSFGLSYRTKLGNDVDGPDSGYRLHLLYGLQAVPDARTFASASNQAAAMEFAWALSSVPQVVVGHRPTAHLSIKSTDVDPDSLAILEGMLYGTTIDDPYLPSMAIVVDLVDNPLIIVDNGDGTWTASGSDLTVALVSPGIFQITSLNAEYVDATTYTLETT